MRARFRSLRLRVALGFFVGALVVSGFITLSTYGLARTYLTRQRLDSVLRQSYNSLRTATEHLGRPGSDRGLDTLATLLHTRGTADVVLVEGAQSVASTVSATLDTVPPALIAQVHGGTVAYALVDDGTRRIVFGSGIPQTRIEAYLVYPLQDLDETLALLTRILLAVVGAAVLAAGAIGLRMARLTFEPLRSASDAAQRVAEGMLDTRLDEAPDELGVLAVSFNRMTDALQERILMERRFVADASHELRTPLTALKTSVDYLAGRDDLPDHLHSTASLAAREVQALQRIVDDLLELSRMEAGAVDVRDEEVDLVDLARELVRHRAGGASVRTQAPDEGLVVRTDKLRLARVVGNLLENAVTHGGHEVAISVERAGGRPTIVIADRGPGIAAADLPRVFERFWRGDHSRRRPATGGAGLGLAIARENAAVLGAELSVSSEAGAGTRAIVRLPADTYVGERGSLEAEA